MDPIDRQVAIDAVAELVSSMSVCASVDECHGMKRMQGMAVRALDNLPSAQPEQQWIPCSERLPHGSCSNLVNVSIHDDSGDTPFDYTSCGWVTTDGEYWIVDNEINNHVVAWMPLPEPWRGAEHETDRR